MDKTVYRSVTLTCDLQKAFEMFTVNKHLEKWLAKEADVEPKVGGKYELFWVPEDKENNSTIGCKILAFQPNKFLSFEWKGPVQFRYFMNTVRPLTQVVVFFIPCSEGIEAHLLHTGWRDTPEWDEARQWFEEAWMLAFQELQNYVNK